MLGDTTLDITVTVSGSPNNYSVSVTPNKLNVNADGIFTIIWQAGSSGVAFTFDSTTPISFTGPHTPLTTPFYNASNNTASCTDTVSANGTYPYVLHLWVGGEEITWPSVRHVGNGDPEIHNDPN